MIITIILGLMIGFAVSIPVGPVNLAIISAAITTDEKRAISLGAGGALMDLIYAMAAFTGISFLNFTRLTTDIFTVIGLIILISLGIKELMFTKTFIDMTSVKPGRKRLYFVKGMMFYLTNPALLPSFVGIAGWVHSQKFISNEYYCNVIAALFVGIGSFLWFTGFSLLIHKYKRKFSMEILTYINKGMGALLILFAFYVGYSYFFIHRAQF